MGLQLVGYYETRVITDPRETRNGEKVQPVLITGPESAGCDDVVDWQTMYYYNASSLLPGQILDIRGRAEVENPLEPTTNMYTNVECVTMCTLNPIWLSNAVQNLPETQIIAPAMGYNISYNAHYAALTFAAFFRVPVQMDSAVIQWRVRCRQTHATCQDHCYIKDGYGFLQIAIFGV